MLVIAIDGPGMISHQAPYDALPELTSCSVPVWMSVLSPTVQLASTQPPMVTEPYELSEALTVGRTFLEPKHQAAFAEYDRLVKKDKDALRSARLEKIVGAIQNNLEQIPELKDRLKELVKEWK